MSHLLSTLNEPDDTDRTQALVTAVHMGREMLSLAERIADSASMDFTSALRYLASALTYLRAASELLPSSGSNLGGAATRAMLRSIAASEAALGHAKLAQSYGACRLPEAFEVQQAARSRVIWKKATEAARQEAHRALAAVAELYPDACSVEPETVR
jgi:hypothetical protein